ncbi:inner nuclear membrane protein enriched at telomere/subtelomere region [Metarhizium acridum]|nr:inner nuclear membrane protein enriched at telomere/subtelomere region [Metarhizium acridum]
MPTATRASIEQERRVQAVADKAVEELRERRAKYECGDLVDEAGQQEDSPAIAEEDLKHVVSKKRNKRLSDEEFDDLWEKAIGKVTTREEVEVQVETTQ